MFMRKKPQAGATIRVLWFLLLASCSLAHGVAMSDGAVGIGPVPAWVKPVTAFDPSIRQDERSDGYYNRLSDFQFNGVEPGNSSTYTAVEYLINDARGARQLSSLAIAFDARHQQLQLHELTIKRGDERINKLDTTPLLVQPASTSAEQQRYDGTRTANLVLKDLEIGDTLRYAYTLTGENPLYKGAREFRVYTQFWQGSGRQHSRILTPEDRPLNRRFRGTDVPLQVNVLEGGIQEIIIEQNDVAAFRVESQVPNWHFRRGTVVFSDMADWQSVLEWALPVYALPEGPMPLLDTLAGVLRATHANKQAQAAAALRWVQSEIRSVKVPLVRHYRQPSPLIDVIASRRGDSREKALLLVALLRKLDMPAEVALVNTQRGLEAGFYPYRLLAFNHVMVHVNVAGASHFLDPTLPRQAGALTDIYQPDYGRALLIDEGTIGLVEMGSDQAGYFAEYTRELIVPRPADNAQVIQMGVMKVNSRYRGRVADEVRHYWQKGQLDVLTQRHFDQYRSHYPTIESRDVTAISESESDGSVSVTRSYALRDFWHSDSQPQRGRRMVADQIIRQLDLQTPQTPQTGRTQPFALRYPVDIDENWIVSVPENVRIDATNEHLITPWFSLTKMAELNEEGDRLTVNFHYNTLAEEVPAEAFEEYSRAIEEVRALAVIDLYHEPVLGAAAQLATEISAAGSLGLLALPLGTLVWIRRQRSGLTILYRGAPANTAGGRCSVAQRRATSIRQ